jgi:hypothetical protein
MKSWFFIKINKIDKSLAKLPKRKRRKAIKKIRDEKEGITTSTNEIQRVIREHFENLCSRLMFKY